MIISSMFREIMVLSPSKNVFSYLIPGCYSTCLCFLFREVMIIVKRDTGERTPVEDIKTSSLSSYETNTTDPYITAYLKTSNLSSSFIIGDNNEYNFKGEKYVNQPLKQNANYIVFLRYFETEVNSDSIHLYIEEPN